MTNLFAYEKARVVNFLLCCSHSDRAFAARGPVEDVAELLIGEALERSLLGQNFPQLA